MIKEICLPIYWNRKTRITTLIAILLFSGWLIYDLQFNNVILISIFILITWTLGSFIQASKKNIHIFFAIVVSIIIGAYSEAIFFKKLGSYSLRDYVEYGDNFNNSRVLVYSLFSGTYSEQVKKYMVHSYPEVYKKAFKTTLFYRHELRNTINSTLTPKEQIIFGVADYFQGKPIHTNQNETKAKGSRRN